MYLRRHQPLLIDILVLLEHSHGVIILGHLHVAHHYLRLVFRTH